MLRAKKSANDDAFCQGFRHFSLLYLSDEMRGNRFKRAIVPLQVSKRVQVKRSWKFDDDLFRSNE